MHHEGELSSEEVRRRTAFRLVALLFPFIPSYVLKFTREGVVKCCDFKDIQKVLN